MLQYGNAGLQLSDLSVAHINGLNHLIWTLIVLSIVATQLLQLTRLIVPLLGQLCLDQDNLSTEMMCLGQDHSDARVKLECDPMKIFGLLLSRGKHNCT
jgi:hypothetical protein